MTDPEQVDALGRRAEDRFGELPPPAQDLVDLAHVKLEAQALGILMVHTARRPAHRTLARERVVRRRLERGRAKPSPRRS